MIGYYYSVKNKDVVLVKAHKKYDKKHVYLQIINFILFIALFI